MNENEKLLLQAIQRSIEAAHILTTVTERLMQDAAKSEVRGKGK